MCAGVMGIPDFLRDEKEKTDAGETCFHDKDKQN
jgi:hypothetical protein